MLDPGSTKGEASIRSPHSRRANTLSHMFFLAAEPAEEGEGDDPQGLWHLFLTHHVHSGDRPSAGKWKPIATRQREIRFGGRSVPWPAP